MILLNNSQPEKLFCRTILKTLHLFCRKLICISCNTNPRSICKYMKDKVLKTLQNQGQLVSQCTIVRHTITFHGDNNRKNHTNNEPALCLHFRKTAMAHSSRLGKRMMLLPFYSQVSCQRPTQKGGAAVARAAGQACMLHPFPVCAIQAVACMPRSRWLNVAVLQS